MTDEVYRVMCDHSILRTLIQEEAPHDVAAFSRAVKASGNPRGLFSYLLELRGDGLFGTIPEDAQASYLSPDFTETGGSVQLVGSDLLSGIYGLALDQLGITYERIDGAVATVRGLTLAWEAVISFSRL